MSRKDNIAIYEQMDPDDNFDVIAYEVHKVRSKNLSSRKFELPDGNIKTYPAYIGECLATNEEFGIYGWTYISLEKAQQKAEELYGKNKRTN